MNKQEIQEKIALLRGQGNQVDLAGVLADVLGAILDTPAQDPRIVGDVLIGRDKGTKSYDVNIGNDVNIGSGTNLDISDELNSASLGFNSTHGYKRLVSCNGSEHIELVYGAGGTLSVNVNGNNIGTLAFVQ